MRVVKIFLEEYCAELRLKFGVDRNVMLIQIPQFVFNSFNPEVAKRAGYYSYPPAGLQWIYSYLKSERNDLNIKILDLNFHVLKRVCEDDNFDYNDWLDILQENLEKFNPSIIAVSCMYDASIPTFKQLLEFLRKKSQSVILTGGLIPSYEHKKLLSEGLCHFAFRGESENKINYLFDFLTGENKNCKPTNGIFYKFNGEYFESEGEKDIVELKGNLIDSYKDLPIEEYYKYGSLNPFSRLAAKEKRPYATIQLNRGCRGSCTFCSVRDFMGQGIRKRDPEEVLKEMEYLITKRGIKHFDWLDDDPLFYKKDFHYILRKIIENKWDITWAANNGFVATSIDDELLKLLKESNCLGFKIGIESGNDEVLAKVNKPARLKNFRKASSLLINYPDIFVGGNYIFGFPDEKFSQMMDTFKFSIEVNLDWGAIVICIAIRGASSFEDFGDYFDEQMEGDEKKIVNFIPTRESKNGGSFGEKEGILRNLDIFKLDLDKPVPDREQLKEIWFTFNLISNYIFNKNLTPLGKIDKFIWWVEMAQQAYATSGYMTLFLALAYVIKGNKEKSDAFYKMAMDCYESDYWRKRFEAFNMDQVLINFPKNKGESYKAIEELRNYSESFYKNV